MVGQESNIISDRNFEKKEAEQDKRTVGEEIWERVDLIDRHITLLQEQNQKPADEAVEAFDSALQLAEEHNQIFVSTAKDKVNGQSSQSRYGEGEILDKYEGITTLSDVMRTYYGELNRKGDIGLETVKERLNAVRGFRKRIDELGFSESEILERALKEEEIGGKDIYKRLEAFDHNFSWVKEKLKGQKAVKQPAERKDSIQEGSISDTETQHDFSSTSLLSGVDERITEIENYLDFILKLNTDMDKSEVSEIKAYRDISRIRIDTTNKLLDELLHQSAEDSIPANLLQLTSEVTSMQQRLVNTDIVNINGNDLTGKYKELKTINQRYGEMMSELDLQSLESAVGQELAVAIEHFDHDYPWVIDNIKGASEITSTDVFDRLDVLINAVEAEIGEAIRSAKLPDQTLLDNLEELIKRKNFANKNVLVLKNPSILEENGPDSNEKKLFKNSLEIDEAYLVPVDDSGDQEIVVGPVEEQETKEDPIEQFDRLKRYKKGVFKVSDQIERLGGDFNTITRGSREMFEEFVTQNEEEYKERHPESEGQINIQTSDLTAGKQTNEGDVPLEETDQPEYKSQLPEGAELIGVLLKEFKEKRTIKKALEITTEVIRLGEDYEFMKNRTGYNIVTHAVHAELINWGGDNFTGGYVNDEDSKSAQESKIEWFDQVTKRLDLADKLRISMSTSNEEEGEGKAYELLATTVMLGQLFFEYAPETHNKDEMVKLKQMYNEMASSIMKKVEDKHKKE